MESSFQRSDAVQDENAIRALEAAYDEAWNLGDIDRLLACMTEDALIVDPRGKVARGHGEIRRLLSPLVGPLGGRSTHNSRIVRVEFVTPNVALVDGRAHVEDLVLGEGQEPTDLFHRFTDVVVRREGQWKIAQIRACPPEADGS